MEIDNDRYGEWKGKVGKLPDYFKFCLGKNWEADQKNGWKEATWTIMHGRNWDALIALMDKTVSMWTMLTEADDLLSNSITKGSVTETATICEKLDDMKEAMDDMKVAMDKMCEDKEDANWKELLERAENWKEPSEDSESVSHASVPLSVSSEIATCKKERLRSIDKRQNVMVFLPANMDCCFQETEIEKALSYLGCEKESIMSTEMVRDRGDDSNEKIVLRVQMDTIKQATKALSNAYKLKNYPVSGIHIAKDMTYQQRLKMRELVGTLRSKIEMLPEYRWKIVDRDWEVVNVGLFKKVETEERV